MMRNCRTIITILCLAFLSAGPAYGQYRDFVRIQTKTRLFSIAFDKKNIMITKLTDGDSVVSAASRENVQIVDSMVRLTNEAHFTQTGMTFQNAIIPYSEISDAEVTSTDDRTDIVFYMSTLPTSQAKRIHEGNMITFVDPIAIEKGDFVRGFVFSVKGSISVSGEVNKDIISLFGNVNLITGAVARGDIVTLEGEVSVALHASLYGEIFSGKKEYDSRQFRFYREREFEPGAMLNYNRVDGLLLGGTCSFVDADSTLPSAEIGLGYALESERLRYHASISHAIVRKFSLKLGAEYYQRLASEDDWLLSNAENSLFVLLLTEDYKDFYETEGFSTWLEIVPKKNLSLTTGYRFNDTHWLKAHRRMWSMFGGHKLFRENFSSVSEPYFSLGVPEIDSTDNGAIFLEAEFDNRDLENSFSSPAWNFSGELEWSHPDLGSDFDYRRYSLSAVRFQPVSKNTAFRFRGKFANSDGYLPMYKRYFLGGFGTLGAYKHKEFMGNRYWMINAEFWINLPLKIRPQLILIWDVAQIANEAKLDVNAEIRHDVGLALRLAGIRLDVSKRLDSASNRDPRLLVRFSRRF